MVNIIIPERKIIPVRIMDCISARNHTPKVKTYPVRIFYPTFGLDSYFGELKQSPLYIPTKPYRFDDSIDKPEQEEGTGEDLDSLTDEIAKQIIVDFKPFRHEIEELLVHCKLGRNRSPAIGLALNEIFKLGNDSEKMRRQFPELREWMYDVMMRNAKYALDENQSP